MSQESDNNKRIAKNTIYLYFRMILVMGVSFYTSRVVLKTLGVSDYGVYNVMGGIIGMLGYVNTLLSGSTSRFLTIELGRNNFVELKKVFSLSNTLCLFSALIFLFLGETIGLWFLNSHLNIDPARMGAANWVYQCSLLSTVLMVLQSPYTASVISHEKMSVYAYMSIFDVVMKLLIVFFLLFYKTDKLKLYAILLFVVNLLNVILYRFYCLKHFPECNYSFIIDKTKMKEMLSYSGWNMIIAFANMLNNYGLNILLNIFFGTVVNAARGLALQVNSVANQLYSNFQTASRPQIFKYYAQGNIEGMSNLINNTAKFSGFLLLCLIVPVWFNIEGLLSVWLEEVPQYTSWFVRIVMLSTFCSAIDLPVGMGINAVGKMKLPNLTSSFLYLVVFPLGYIAMKYGASPIASYSIYISITPVILLVDLLILRKYTGFSIINYMKKVIIPVICIASISVIGPILINIADNNLNIIHIVFRSVACLFYVVIIIFIFGMSKKLKLQIIAKINHNLKGK